MKFILAIVKGRMDGCIWGKKQDEYRWISAADEAKGWVPVVYEEREKADAALKALIGENSVCIAENVRLEAKIRIPYKKGNVDFAVETR